MFQNNILLAGTKTIGHTANQIQVSQTDPV